ncbi:MAG: acyl--CoA ligase [Bdellovibrionales bacterium]|nr:acyl--CoA ligase [Bdellovibrionales bacterium]
MTSLRRTGREVQSNRFRSFRERFDDAVAQFGARGYILQVAPQGQECRRTLIEVKSDVDAIRVLIRKKFNAVSTIATHAGNTYSHLVWIVATLLENKVLCPMNPNETPERTASKLASLGDSYRLVSDDEETVRLLGADRMVIPEGDVDTAILKTALPPRDPDMPFILIFTSGTTGYSKIVQQTERGVLTNVDDLIRHHQLSPRDRICTPLPVFHVNALEFSFFCSLLSGAGLVLFEHFDLLRILKVLQREKITILSLIPQMVHLLAQESERFKASAGESFRYVVTAAAPLPPALARDWILKFGDQVRILQGYGLSEAVNFSATMPTNLSFEVYRKLLLDFQRPSIGVELEGNDILVVDEQGRLCGAEQIGEVCIRGANVMLGYRGHGDQQPFSGEMLHTGDTGFYTDLEDGRRCFFITGRKKDVIKTLGETISLVEIDDVLIELSPTTQAIAVGFPNDFEGEAIGVVVKNSPTANVDDVKRLLTERLPAFMWPRRIFKTDQDVKTASGKSCRWKFKELFRNLEHVRLGREPQDE